MITYDLKNVDLLTHTLTRYTENLWNRSYVSNIKNILKIIENHSHGKLNNHDNTEPLETSNVYLFSNNEFKSSCNVFCLLTNHTTSFLTCVTEKT